MSIGWIIFAGLVYFLVDLGLASYLPDLDSTVSLILGIVLTGTVNVLVYWILRIMEENWGITPAGVVQDVLAALGLAEPRRPQRPGGHARPEAPHIPEIPQREVRRSSARIYLRSLQLILTPRGSKKLSLGRFANPDNFAAGRPVAEIVLNDKSLVGRRLPLEFNIVDPNGAIRYEFPLKPQLKRGMNRVAPEEFFRIARNVKQGTWRIRLWVGNRSWAEQTFVISTKNADALVGGMIGGDMEVDIEDAVRQAETVEGASIDDLLES